MLAEARVAIEERREPIWSAWLDILASAEAACERKIVIEDDTTPPDDTGALIVYQGRDVERFRAAGVTTDAARDLGLAYALTDEARFAEQLGAIIEAYLDDHRRYDQPFLPAWVPKRPSEAGFVTSQAIVRLGYAYTLGARHPAVPTDEFEALLREYRRPIRGCDRWWMNSSHIGWSNHYSAHMRGFATIGYLTGDEELASYAIHGTPYQDWGENAHSLSRAIGGAIFTANADPDDRSPEAGDQWRSLPLGGPHHTDRPDADPPAPPVRTGELWDRQRRRDPKPSGLGHVFLHLTFLIEAAELATCNGDTTDWWGYEAPPPAFGESFADALHFYAPFFIQDTMAPVIDGDPYTYYAEERERDVPAAHVYEVAHMRLPDDAVVTEALGALSASRGVRPIGSPAVLSHTAVVTHGSSAPPVRGDSSDRGRGEA